MLMTILLLVMLVITKKVFYTRVAACGLLVYLRIASKIVKYNFDLLSKHQTNCIHKTHSIQSNFFTVLTFYIRKCLVSRILLLIIIIIVIQK